MVCGHDLDAGGWDSGRGRALAHQILFIAVDDQQARIGAPLAQEPEAFDYFVEEIPGPD